MASKIVFVGNLAFKTKEESLSSAFEKAGKVVNANIITRGPRSLGYGFVEMDSVEAAKKAVDIMHHQQLDGRQINVEIAKPREEQQQGEKPKRAPRANFRGRRGQEGEEHRGEERRGEERRGEERRGEGRGRGRGRGSFRGGEGRGGFRRGRGGFRGEQGEGRGGFRRGRGFRGGQRGGQERPQRVVKTPEERQKERQEREKNRVPSTTTLFVANLPFSYDDAAFEKLFKDNGLKYQSVHVVVKRNKRSKGFGFAEFAKQEDQVAALNKLNKFVADGRELITKIAFAEEAKKRTRTKKIN